MSWAVLALFFARWPADAPFENPARLQGTWRVVVMSTGGEAHHDAGGRLAAQRDRDGSGTLRLRIVERKADRVAPIPARVHLADASGKPVLAPGLPA
jgi:hypothetical protein